MPRPYRGPQRSQIIAYVPPTVKLYIRHMAAQETGGSETEFISRILTAEFNRALLEAEPIALLVGRMGNKDAGQNLEGS